MYEVAASGELVSFVYGPPETVEEYVLYPITVDALGDQLNVTE